MGCAERWGAVYTKALKCAQPPQSTAAAAWGGGAAPRDGASRPFPSRAPSMCATLPCPPPSSHCTMNAGFAGLWSAGVRALQLLYCQPSTPWRTASTGACTHGREALPAHSRQPARTPCLPVSQRTSLLSVNALRAPSLRTYVPGRTCAARERLSELMSELLPTLGRPTMPTVMAVLMSALRQ